LKRRDVRRSNSCVNPACPPPFQAWLEAEAVAGPQRSYRLARKLPEQLRRLGRTAAARADWAVAHTLFWMGRFEESHALLAAIRIDAITPEADTESNLALRIPLQLSWALALLGEAEEALEQARRAADWVDAQPKNPPDRVHLALACNSLGLLYCFLDMPDLVLAWSRRAQEFAVASSDMDEASLLEYWALSRLGRATDEARVQTALANLRRHSPAQEARAFSLYAQALFHHSPSHALTQLDAALDLNARFGLHHWEARLLQLKSQSLDAAGQLTEASRFLRLASEVAQRQGARLFLDGITGIESRTQAGSHMENPA
jgi:tetratricopeptide (TPR) repeat protein